VEEDSNLLCARSRLNDMCQTCSQGIVSVLTDGSKAVDEEVVDTGSVLVVDEGSTSEAPGRGAAPTTTPPDPWGRGARFLIMARFML
jgi:hypothetical protein